MSYDSIEIHKKFAGEYGITFPLIADEKKAVRNLYAKGRITFLIDRNGIIRYIKKGVPENSEFIRQIEILQYPSR